MQGWEAKLREDGQLIISNLSLNEERVFSSRVRGKLSIILDNQNLLLAINWGDFANLSDANVFYNIKEYGIFEEDWKLSNDGKVAYSPNPLLMLLEILVSDTLIIIINTSLIVSKYILDKKVKKKHEIKDVSDNEDEEEKDISENTV